MRCTTSRRYIELRLDRELRDSHIPALDKHLGNCSRCREYQAQATKLKSILRSNTQRKEFPSWLHQQILSQATAHDNKRHAFRQRWQLRLVPSLMALVLSLTLGLLLGRVTYNTANPYPSLTMEHVQNQEDSQQVASFGETSLIDYDTILGEEQ